MDFEGITVEHFYDQHGVKLFGEEDWSYDYIERWYDWGGEDFLSDQEEVIKYEYRAKGFRIDLGQGVFISGSLPNMLVAEVTTLKCGLHDGIEHYDDAVMAAINAKCGVFNRELIG